METEKEKMASQGAELGPILVVIALIAVIIGSIAYIIFSKEKNTEPPIEEKPVIEEQEEGNTIPEAVEEEQEEGEPIDEEEKIVGVDVIKQYYSHIGNKDIDMAYAMYHEEFTDYQTFQKWYRSVTYIAPYSFTDLGDDTYRFFVDIKETGIEDETFQVTMKVIDEKIKTLSSVQTRSLFNDENRSVYERQYRTKVELVYEANGWLSIVASGDDYRVKDYSNSDLTAGKPITLFESVIFSDSGKYLSFDQISGVEGGGAGFVFKLYDTSKRSIVYTSGGTFHSLTSDEQHLVDCSDNEMSDIHYAKVISLPSFEVVFDAERDTAVVQDLATYDLECELLYDKDQSIRMTYDNLYYIGTPDVPGFTLTYNRKTDDVKFDY